MRTDYWRRLKIAAVMSLAAGSAAGLHGVGAAEQAAAPAPVPESAVLNMPAAAPPGAILLFTGKPEQIAANWTQRYTTAPAAWTVNAAGVATPNGHDINTRQEFGDCYVHVEFQEPINAQGASIGDGNSGVGLQGRYEIQILNSYGRKPEEHQCGALYSQKPPRVIASRPAGQWQSFDIVFRAPRYDEKGQLTEKPRATVFQNGILVQNNEEFLGPTGIQYGELKGMPKTGPLTLQGDHDPVKFRNVWIVPL
ncbi:MAG: DUF1080 domain-containing protein [Chloroflexi bacterium]|nr:DUF1080 domain-containing protein [Chloroflexota bacterium]